jgi:hypothetical protein
VIFWRQRDVPNRGAIEAGGGGGGGAQLRRESDFNPQRTNLDRVRRGGHTLALVFADANAVNFARLHIKWTVA